LKNFSFDVKVVHMYYLMMKLAFKPILKSKNFCISKSYTRLIEEEKSYVNSKFYQKLLILLISFSTILIFPDSPKELVSICENHNYKKICNVW